jgi:Ni,Fe-hydrogenase I cytochrome b subunit
MPGVLTLSAETTSTAGVLLLTLVAVESGGWFMLRVVRGSQPATPFQQAFFRAGHAHAGVLVILALVGQIYADAAHLGGPLSFPARNGIWAAAILMSGGFFLSATGRGTTKPNRLIALVYAGAVSLAVGLVALGIGLLSA